MTAYYFNPSAAPGGAGTSSGSPFQTPDDLPTSYLLEGGNSYLFACDETHNFEDMLQTSTSSTTSGHITVGSYGTGAKPIITRYRLLDASECTEVTISGGDATTSPSPGSNLWKVPRQFFGRFEDGTWGVRSDPADDEGSANTNTPYDPKDWAYADFVSGSPESCIIYSVGNPVTNWGVLVNNYLDAQNLNTNHWYCFGFNQTLDGFTVSGLDFRDCYGGVAPFVGSTAQLSGVTQRMIPNVVIEDCDAWGIRSLVVFGGGNSLTLGHGFYRARVRRNYCENLGGSAFNQNSSGMCMNGLRIHDNVIYGACNSESSGGIYFSLIYCNDGGRAIIEYNTVSGVKYGNLFPTDGYGLYTEQQSADIEYRHNFVYDCEQSALHSNRPYGNILFHHNYCLVQVGGVTAAGFSPVFDVASAHVTLWNNVNLGYDRFAGVGMGDIGLFESRANVSILVDDAGGNTSFIRTGAGYVTGKVISDYDNAYGHGLWLDANGTDKTVDATNRNTSDPSVEVARIPIPIDTEAGHRTNYARLCSPNWWSSTVSLRMGTRFA